MFTELPSWVTPADLEDWRACRRHAYPASAVEAMRWGGFIGSCRWCGKPKDLRLSPEGTADRASGSTPKRSAS